MKTKRQGFSLIELLVVVGIIALLASLLLPSLNRVRQKARQIVCAGNLRQFGLATQMYLDDFRRFFPYAKTMGSDRLWYFGLESPFNPSGAPGARHIDLTKAKLYPYFRTLHGIEICPSYDYKSLLWRQKYDQVTDGYGLNWYLFDQSAQIAEPTRIACFTDTAQVNNFQAPASSTNPMIEEWYYFDDGVPYVQFRHNDRANVLLADGHVESLPMSPGTLDTRLPQLKIGRLNANGDLSMFQ